MKSRPLVIIHGGCGSYESASIPYEKYDETLRPIVRKTYEILAKEGARSAAVEGLMLLENEEIFNAGTGSKLQRDGKARMSASFMDGKRKRFGAAINVENIRHPVELAFRLSSRKHSILAGVPATRFARNEEDMPKHDPVTEMRIQEFEERKEGESGTAGVVVLDASGRICAATSTGGIGYEIPGRVGDTPTIAGNFANAYCGISCTGIGEQIVNHSVAASVATRVEDGILLEDAVRRTLSKAKGKRDRFGLISLDRKGNWQVGQTESARVLYAVFDGSEIRTFLEG